MDFSSEELSSPAERAAIFTLRHDIYVRELGSPGARALDEQLRDADDESPPARGPRPRDSST